MTAEPESLRELLNALRPGARLYADRVGEALRSVLADESWRGWTDPLGQPHRYKNFDDFIEVETRFKVPVVIATLESDDPQGWKDVLDAIAVVRRAQTSVRITHQESETVRRTIARLKRDHPALARQVIDGEITAHAAAISAGIRHPRAYIRTDDVGKAVDVLLRHYDKNEILEVLS